MANSNPQQAFPPLKLIKLKENLYLATGGAGADSGIVVGKSHVFLIDAKMTADTARELSSLIAQTFSKPVAEIVLTHSDIDHVGGIDSISGRFTLVSHETTKREMIAQQERVHVEHLPDITFTDKYLADFEGVQADLLHFGPAHTAGDTVVFFPSLRIAFVGDLLFFQREPLIHRQKGGSVTGLIEAFSRLLDLDADTFVSGHSAPVGKDEIRTLRETVVKRRDAIKALASAGTSWERVRHELGIEEAALVPGRPIFPTLAEVIYREETGS
jgi:cyclase